MGAIGSASAPARRSLPDEICLPAPVIAEVHALVVCAESSLFTPSFEERYRPA